jgi:hypothetical protein
MNILIRSEKAQNNIGSFYNDKILVKLKENVDLTYFKENGYCDYRCGCDLCGSGDAYGFKTNFLKLCSSVESNEWFELNDLDIEIENTWYDKDSNNYSKDIKVKCMNETENRYMIEKIYELYILFNPNNFMPHTYEPLTGTKSSSRILSSCFLDNNTSNVIEPTRLRNIKSVHVCDLCHTWLTVVEGDTIYDNFIEVNPLKYFWMSVVTDFLSDLIEFKDDDQKLIFNKNNDMIQINIDDIDYISFTEIKGTCSVDKFLEIIKCKYEPLTNSKYFTLIDWIDYFGAEIVYKIKTT